MKLTQIRWIAKSAGFEQTWRHVRRHNSVTWPDPTIQFVMVGVKRMGAKLCQISARSVNAFCRYPRKTLGGAGGATCITSPRAGEGWGRRDDSVRHVAYHSSQLFKRTVVVPFWKHDLYPLTEHEQKRHLTSVVLIWPHAWISTPKKDKLTSHK